MEKQILKTNMKENSSESFENWYFEGERTATGCAVAILMVSFLLLGFGFSWYGRDRSDKSST